MESKAYVRVSASLSKPLRGLGRALRPGLRVGEGVVTSVEASGYTLSVEVEVSGSVSESVVELLRRLEEELGRVGADVVNVEVEELRAVLRFDEPVPPDLPSRVCSIPEVLNASLMEGRVLRVLMKPMTVTEVEAGIPDRVITVIRSSVRRLPRPKPKLRAGRMRKTVFLEDPTMVAVELGWVKELPDGMWAYTPPYVGLLRALEELFVHELEALGFSPVSTPGGDAARPCLGLWRFLEGMLYELGSLPVKLYQPPRWAPNPSRRDLTLRNPPELLILDAAYLGDEGQASEVWDKLLDAVLDLLDGKLDVEWRVSEEPSTSRVEVYLPYTGPRDRADWKPVATLHRPDAGVAGEFNIRVEECREIWAGCMRVDLTATAFAFLSQKGFNPDSWPEGVRGRLRKGYKVPKSILWPPGG